MNNIYINLIAFGFFILAIIFLFEINVFSLFNSVRHILDDGILGVLDRESSKKKVVLHDLAVGKKVKTHNKQKIEINEKYRQWFVRGVYVLALVFILLIVSQKSILMIPIVYGIIVFIEIIGVVLKKRAHDNLTVDLHTSLGFITTTYMNTSTLEQAIKVNKDIIPTSIRGVFISYLGMMKNIGGSQKSNLERIRGKIDHALWSEWISAVQDSLENSDYRKTIREVLKRFTLEREVTEKAEREMHKSRMTFFQVAGLSLFAIFGAMLVRNDIYDMAFNDVKGNIVLVVTLVMIITAFRIAFKIMYAQQMKY